jgi:hypothetical protein
MADLPGGSTALLVRDYKGRSLRAWLDGLSRRTATRGLFRSSVFCGCLTSRLAGLAPLAQFKHDPAWIRAARRRDEGARVSAPRPAENRR